MSKQLMAHTIEATAQQDANSARAGVTTRLPPLVLPIAGLIFVLFGFGPNWLLAAASLLCFLAICALLWRPGETPVLLYIFAFQWIESSLAIFHANVVGLSINELNLVDGDRQFATVLLLGGLLVTAVGVRLATGAAQPALAESIRRQAKQVSQRTWLKFYVATFAISLVAKILAGLFPSLSQPFLALNGLKWAAYIIFTYATFIRPDASRFIWFLVFLFEFLFSLGGYFSNFKLVLVATLIGFVATSVRLPASKLFGILILASVSLLLAVIWTTIKPEYRSFVSDGENAQEVYVGYGQQLDQLAKQISELTLPDLQSGAEALLVRIEYVDYFAAATSYVPRTVPHTSGELWFESIMRPMMPRALFSSKSEIDESALTIEYTGIEVGGWDSGAQISIGYLGESYIDFGAFGMMVFLLPLGYSLGRIYRWLLEGKYSTGLLGQGQASAILMSNITVGASSAKLIGAIAVSVLVLWLFNKYIVPRWFPWLQTPTIVA